jgi:pyridoxamine 5'-phosphate oxidase
LNKGTGCKVQGTRKKESESGREREVGKMTRNYLYLRLRKQKNKMDFKDCIKFTNENPVCYLATTIENQPRVRAIGMWFADETGFYFQTGAFKEFPHELKKNPKTEACFYKHEGIIGTMLRISGEVEFVENRKLKEKVINDRPFLKDMGLTVDSPDLMIFRISHGTAHFWTMATNLKPKEIIAF